MSAAPAVKSPPGWKRFRQLSKPDDKGKAKNQNRHIADLAAGILHGHPAMAPVGPRNSRYPDVYLPGATYQIKLALVQEYGQRKIYPYEAPYPGRSYPAVAGFAGTSM